MMLCMLLVLHMTSHIDSNGGPSDDEHSRPVSFHFFECSCSGFYLVVMCRNMESFLLFSSVHHRSAIDGDCLGVCGLNCFQIASVSRSCSREITSCILIIITHATQKKSQIRILNKSLCLMHD